MEPGAPAVAPPGPSSAIAVAEWSKFEREKRRADELKAKVEAQQRAIREAEEALEKRRLRRERRRWKHAATAAAVRVQAIVRGYRCRKMVPLDRFRHAVLRIQPVLRGFIARMEASRIAADREALRAELLEEYKDEAAVYIQAIVRGWAGRREAKRRAAELRAIRQRAREHVATWLCGMRRVFAAKEEAADRRRHRAAAELRACHQKRRVELFLVELIHKRRALAAKEAEDAADKADFRRSALRRAQQQAAKARAQREAKRREDAARKARLEEAKRAQAAAASVQRAKERDAVAAEKAAKLREERANALKLRQEQNAVRAAARRAQGIADGNDRDDKERVLEETRAKKKKQIEMERKRREDAKAEELQRQASVAKLEERRMTAVRAEAARREAAKQKEKAKKAAEAKAKAAALEQEKKLAEAKRAAAAQREAEKSHQLLLRKRQADAQRAKEEAEAVAREEAERKARQAAANEAFAKRLERKKALAVQKRKEKQEYIKRLEEETKAREEAEAETLKRASEQAAKRLQQRKAKEMKERAAQEAEAARREKALLELQEQERLRREKAAQAARKAKEAAKEKRVDMRLRGKERRVEAGLAAELGTDFPSLFGPEHPVDGGHDTRGDFRWTPRPRSANSVNPSGPATDLSPYKTPFSRATGSFGAKHSSQVPVRVAQMNRTAKSKSLRSKGGPIPASSRSQPGSEGDRGSSYLRPFGGDECSSQSRRLSDPELAPAVGGMFVAVDPKAADLAGMLTRAYSKLGQAVPPTIRQLPPASAHGRAPSPVAAPVLAKTGSVPSLPSVPRLNSGPGSPFVSTLDVRPHQKAQQRYSTQPMQWPPALPTALKLPSATASPTRPAKKGAGRQGGSSSSVDALDLIDGPPGLAQDSNGPHLRRRAPPKLRHKASEKKTKGTSKKGRKLKKNKSSKSRRSVETSVATDSRQEANAKPPTKAKLRTDSSNDCGLGSERDGEAAESPRSRDPRRSLASAFDDPSEDQSDVEGESLDSDDGGGSLDSGHSGPGSRPEPPNFPGLGQHHSASAVRIGERPYWTFGGEGDSDEPDGGEAGTATDAVGRGTAQRARQSRYLSPVHVLEPREAGEPPESQAASYRQKSRSFLGGSSPSTRSAVPSPAAPPPPPSSFSPRTLRASPSHASVSASPQPVPLSKAPPSPIVSSRHSPVGEVNRSAAGARAAGGAVSAGVDGDGDGDRDGAADIGIQPVPPCSPGFRPQYETPLRSARGSHRPPLATGGRSNSSRGPHSGPAAVKTRGLVTPPGSPPRDDSPPRARPSHDDKSSAPVSPLMTPQRLDPGRLAARIDALGAGMSDGYDSPGSESYSDDFNLASRSASAFEQATEDSI